MKKLVITVVLLAVGVSLYAQKYLNSYESSDELLIFGRMSRGIGGVLKYDRNNIDAAMSELQGWAIAATELEPGQEAKHLERGYFDEYPYNQYMNRIKGELSEIIQALDRQQGGERLRGKEYSLYVWELPYTIHETVYYLTFTFYYFKVNGQIRYNYLMDSYVLLNVSDNLYYEEERGIVKITGCRDVDYISGEAISGEVIIPKEIDGLSVTYINSFAFRNKTITSVVIPSSVRDIGEGAFANSKLTSITIPSTLDDDARKAFTGSPIKTITLVRQERVWPSGDEPRGGSERETYFTDYLDDFFYNKREPGTYTWDGANWSFTKTEIPGDFFAKDSRGYSGRSPGLYTWEDGGWSYQSEDQYFSYSYGGNLPAPGIYKWENGTWVYHQY